MAILHASSILVIVILSLSTGSTTLAQQPDPPVLTGSILEADGVSIPSAQVELVPYLSRFESGRLLLEQRPDPSPVASTTSDARGRFRLVAPGAGVFRVVVRAEGHLAMHYQPCVLTHSTELEPVIPPRSQERSLRLADPSGEPIAGNWVFARKIADGRTNGAPASSWRPEFRLGLTDGEGRPCRGPTGKHWQ